MGMGVKFLFLLEDLLLDQEKIKTHYLIIQSMLYCFILWVEKA